MCYYLLDYIPIINNIWLHVKICIHCHIQVTTQLDIVTKCYPTLFLSVNVNQAVRI